MWKCPQPLRRLSTVVCSVHLIKLQRHLIWKYLFLPNWSKLKSFYPVPGVSWSKSQPFMFQVNLPLLQKGARGASRPGRNFCPASSPGIASREPCSVWLGKREASRSVGCRHKLIPLMPVTMRFDGKRAFVHLELQALRSFAERWSRFCKVAPQWYLDATSLCPTTSLSKAWSKAPSEGYRRRTA